MFSISSRLPLHTTDRTQSIKSSSSPQQREGGVFEIQLLKDHPSKERILQQLPLFLSHVIPNKVPSVPNYSLITDASSVITNSTKVYIATKEHHGIITGLEQIQQNANLSGNKGLILSVLHAKDQILENLFGIGRQNTIGIMSRV